MIVAVMLLDIFEASITVDGIDLPEYNITSDQDTQTATCWILFKVGKVRLTRYCRRESRYMVANLTHQASAFKYRNTVPSTLVMGGHVTVDGL